MTQMRQEMRFMPAAKDVVEKKRRAEHYRGGLSLNEPSSVESDLHPPVYISFFLSTLFSKIAIFLFIFLNPRLLLVRWLCIFIYLESFNSSRIMSRMIEEDRRELLLLVMVLLVPFLALNQSFASLFQCSQPSS